MRIVRSRCKKPATPIINRDLIAIFNFVRNFLPHFQLATVKTLSTKTAWRINDTMMGRYHLGSSTVNTEKEAIKSLHCYYLAVLFTHNRKAVISRIINIIALLHISLDNVIGNDFLKVYIPLSKAKKHIACLIKRLYVHRHDFLEAFVIIRRHYTPIAK